jgi:hypothetical protein
MSVGAPEIVTEALRGFPQSYRQLLGQCDRFLPDPFRFITRESCHSLCVEGPGYLSGSATRKADRCVELVCAFVAANEFGSGVLLSYLSLPVC